MEEKIEKLETFISNLRNKEFKLLFYVPDLKNQVAGSIYEIYRHVKTLNEFGYNAYIFVEEKLKKDKDTDKAYEIPTWFEEELQQVPHLSMKENITISPSDFLFMMEFFPVLMEQTKNLPCEKIAIFQSYDLFYNAFSIGSSFSTFNYNKVLTTCSNLKHHLSNYPKLSLNVKTYKLGIPEYFKPRKRTKSLYIPFLSRNPNDINKVVKMFYLKYPQFQQITFEDMSGYTREEFAEKLKGAPITLWLDRIASFGTFPLESMTAGAIPVALIPDMQPEYMKYDNGIWLQNILEVPDKIYDVLVAYMQDNVPQELWDGISNTVDEYSVDKYKKSFIQTIEEYVDERITFLSSALDVEAQTNNN